MPASTPSVPSSIAEPDPLPPGTAVGIIAGSGRFPLLIARKAKEKGLKVVICGLRGNTDPALADQADAFTMLPIGQFGTLIAFLKKHKVTRACMAGAVSKPKALDLKPDLRAAKILFRLARNGPHKGDDALLRAVTQELEGEGIVVVRPDSLVPSLRGPQGVLSKRAPSEEEMSDIRFGLHVVRQLGRLDIGQCVVVKQGIVVAVEALEGTDATIARAGELAGPGCIMIKTAKPDQDERLDLPSIGKTTVEILARHKYACLAFEAKKTLFFDQEGALTLADAAGIAVIGVPSE